ncbi:MAG: hypothetical protein ACLFVU_05360 [Phycisphaerae bacterium]
MDQTVPPPVSFETDPSTAEPSGRRSLRISRFTHIALILYGGVLFAGVIRYVGWFRLSRMMSPKAIAGNYHLRWAIAGAVVWSLGYLVVAWVLSGSFQRPSLRWIVRALLLLGVAVHLMLIALTMMDFLAGPGVMMLANVLGTFGGLIVAALLFWLVFRFSRMLYGHAMGWMVLILGGLALLGRLPLIAGQIEMAWRLITDRTMSGPSGIYQIAGMASSVSTLCRAILGVLVILTGIRLKRAIQQGREYQEQVAAEAADVG